jgi:hypothetical protein
MDEKGFIFTVDASLALIVVIVFAASMATYYFSPIFMGDDHQHLEALADSALAVMEQDGTITNAAAESNKGDITGAQAILNNRLTMLIPNEIAYNMSMTYTTPVTVQNDRGLLYSRDTATKVRVLSLPQEGWMGRAWYKIEKFEFENQTQNVTTTLWNFHNWLTNFAPWSSNNGQLATVGKWGASSSSPYNPMTIQFSYPTGATILGAQYLVGSCNRNTSGNGPAFGTNLTVNSNVYNANSNQYVFLYRRPSVLYPMYNYQGIIPVANLNNGVNTFNLKFLSPVYNYISNSQQGHDLPWFSIIGNYTTSFPVPKGIISQTYNFPDAAGMAVQTAQDLGGGGGEYGRIYDLKTGGVTSFKTQRVISWASYAMQDNPTYEDGRPFVITGVTGGGIPSGVAQTKCAVSTTQNIYVPPDNTIFDAFTVINPYGGVDGAMVEVKNGTTWHTVFRAFNSNEGTTTATTDGYGNIPGIVSIPTNYLTPGVQNKVRITIWDDVPSNDYDLVGLVNCYSKVTYSALNIGWVNSYYDNYQNSSNTETQTKSFDIMDNAKNVYLFCGIGLDSRHIKVNYPGGATLYDSDTTPYYLDLAAIDAGLPVAQRKITTTNSTPSLYWLKTGTKYNLTVTVTGPPSGQYWQSGDTNGNAEIFSGTRIAVIYPESLRNVWNIAYAPTAPTAELNAKNNLIAALNTSDPNVINSIKTEALFTGNNPNQIPVRLTLWKD